jgi:hypothetical protein
MITSLKFPNQTLVARPAQRGQKPSSGFWALFEQAPQSKPAPAAIAAPRLSAVRNDRPQSAGVLPAASQPGPNQAGSGLPALSSFGKAAGVAREAQEDSVSGTQTAASLAAYQPETSKENSIDGGAPGAEAPNNGPDSPPVTDFIPNVPGMDLSHYALLIPPVSLQPLLDEMRRQGLDPNRFQFTELQSYDAFPTRPDWSVTMHQLLIQGPNGAKLYDLDWSLRTPWVTTVDVKSSHIA